jgi:hypothetical protein
MSEFQSLEPEDRRQALFEAAKKYGLDILVETGTNQGLTPAALHSVFDRIFTIEIYQPLYDAAKKMLSKYPNVTCFRGDSTDVLPLILGKIDKPALFWLDGHYSGPGTGHGTESTPIREELEIIFKDGRPHVIYVDDARIFGGGPEENLYEHYETYPTLKWVEEYADENGYDYKLWTDIIRLTPRETN